MNNPCQRSRSCERLCAEFGWSEREVCRFVMIDQGRKRFGDTFWIVLGKTPQLEPLYILWEYLTPEEREFFCRTITIDRKSPTKEQKGFITQPNIIPATYGFRTVGC